MKKLKILKIIFWIWFFLLVCFGGYCIYYLIGRIDTLALKFIETNINKSFNHIIFRSVEKIERYLDFSFKFSVLSLIILYIVLIVFFMVMYAHFKDLKLFYICNECSEGTVFIDKCRFNLKFNDSDNKIVQNHSQRHQLFYKKIYLKRDGNIDIFYDKNNPKKFIIGNKPTFLMNFFVKPFFLDLFLFSLIFAGLYFCKPFLFLNFL